MPFTTTVLGNEVQVVGIGMQDDESVAAVCRRGNVRQRIPILDLPLPSPPPAAKSAASARKRCPRSPAASAPSTARWSCPARIRSRTPRARSTPPHSTPTASTPAPTCSPNSSTSTSTSRAGSTAAKPSPPPASPPPTATPARLSPTTASARSCRCAVRRAWRSAILDRAPTHRDGIQNSNAAPTGAAARGRIPPKSATIRQPALPGSKQHSAVSSQQPALTGRQAGVSRRCYHRHHAPREPIAPRRLGKPTSGAGGFRSPS